MLYFLNNLWYAKLKIGILYHVVILSLVVGLAVDANKEFLKLFGANIRKKANISILCVAYLPDWVFQWLCTVLASLHYGLTVHD